MKHAIAFASSAVESLLRDECVVDAFLLLLSLLDDLAVPDIFDDPHLTSAIIRYDFLSL